MKFSRIIIVLLVAALALSVMPGIVSGQGNQTRRIIHHESQGQGDPSWTECRPESAWNGHHRHEGDWIGDVCGVEPTQVPPTSEPTDVPPTATPVQPTNPPPTSTDVPVQPTSTSVPVASPTPPTPPPTPTFPAIIGTPPTQPTTTAVPRKSVPTRVPKTWPTVTPVDSSITYCAPTVITVTRVVTVYVTAPAYLPLTGGSGGPKGRR